MVGRFDILRNDNESRRDYVGSNKPDQRLMAPDMFVEWVYEITPPDMFVEWVYEITA